jgi:hypothetical protein
MDSGQVAPGLEDKIVGDTAAAGIVAVAAGTAPRDTVAVGKVIVKTVAAPKGKGGLRREDTGLSNNQGHPRVLPSKSLLGSEDVSNS